MCGRAKLPDDVSEIKLDLKIDFDEIGDYQPRWNAAPTTKLPVVVSAGSSRILTLMRWGLIPSWAKDLKIGYDFQRPRRNLSDARGVPGRLAGWATLSRPCRRLLRMARCRQAAVRDRACQSRPDDARWIMGGLAFAGG